MGLLDLIGHKYPFTDFHELNLDWCITAILQLQKAFEVFSAGNKLFFADPLQHDLTKSYAKNTIVVDPVSGSAYLSLDTVPKGVQLDNTNYWLPVFDFAGYVTRANQNFTDNYFSGTDRTPYTLLVGDWVVLDDVLYKVTVPMAADDLFIIGTNIVHFTVEQFLKDFIATVNQTLYNYSLTIQQYKADIDASELAYRNQLAQDIADTTASLQAQLDLAISGATVDSEVINARLGANGVTYSTLGDAIRTQFDLAYALKDAIVREKSVNAIATPLMYVSVGDTIEVELTSKDSPGNLNFVVHPYAAGDPLVQFSSVLETKSFTANKSGNLVTGNYLDGYTANIRVITRQDAAIDILNDKMSRLTNREKALLNKLEIDHDSAAQLIYLYAGETISIEMLSKDSGTLNFVTNPYAAGDPICSFSTTQHICQTFTAVKDGYVQKNWAFTGNYSAVIRFINNVPNVINLTNDITTPIILNGLSNLIIKGNNHKINLAKSLTSTVGVDGYLHAAHNYTSGDNVDKVFVSQTLPLINTSSGVARTYYPNVALWILNGDDYDNAIELTPVASYADLADTPNSFTYVDADSEFVVNTTQSGSLYLSPDSDLCLSLTNCNADIYDLTMMFGAAGIVSTTGSDVRFHNCKALFCKVTRGFYSESDNIAEYEHCESIQNNGDGFSSNGTKYIRMYDCRGAYNHDDGVSNHGDLGYGNQEEFIIDGCKFIENRKAGIASPVYGSSGMIKNNVVDGNLIYGISAATIAAYPVDEMQYIMNNVIINNNIGVYNDGYNVTLVNNTYNDNATDKSGVFTDYD